ncbi:MAG: hypothetical protein U0514_01415 [Candidatus Andersenbacteria bacterium]
MAEASHTGLKQDAAEFVRFVAERSVAPAPDDSPRIQTEELSSSIARLYEQLRNTVDNTDQHLLRRNAIHRFLRRQVLVYRTSPSRLGELLVRDLVRTGYVPNGTFPERDVPRIDAIIAKYRRLSDELQGRLPESPRSIANWVLGLASVEIEQAIYDPSREEALIRYAFDVLKPRIVWEDAAFDPEDRDLQLYAALHRATFKSDARLIEYHLLTSYYPGWRETTEADAHNLAHHILGYRDVVRNHLAHPNGPRLAQQVRRMVIPYQALLDVVKEHPTDALERLDDEKTFIADVRGVVDGYYAKNRTGTRRSTVRSIMFIFITKMLLALALEVPYDFWVLGSLSYVPLIINVTFHPLLLLVLGTTARFPDKENTKRILSDLWTSIRADRTPSVYHVRLLSRRSEAAKVLLGVVYVLTFAVTTGALIWLLAWLGFNWLDGTLFLLFLSLVTFVGIRLRTRAGEYFMVQRRVGLLGSLFLFFANPLLEVGYWFSVNVRRYNLFLFIFDIVLEAPFKALTYAIEEWFGFARERSERITG